MRPIWQYELGVYDGQYYVYLSKYPVYAEIVERIGVLITRIPFGYPLGSRVMLWADAKRQEERRVPVTERQMWEIDNDYVRMFNLEAPDQ